MKKNVIIAVALMIIIALFGFDIYTNYKQLQCRNEIMTSDKIDEDTDNFLIGWFSDMYYGDNFNIDDVHKLVTKMNDYNPDMIIFTGDLLEKESLSSDEETAIIEELSSMKPKYGKFAVLGDNDLILRRAQTILSESGFEIIDNRNKVIAIDMNSKINLIGLGNMINGTVDINTAFYGINSEYFTIVASHCPDTYQDLKDYSFDLMLSGHSLGGKFRIPVISWLLANEGSKSFYHGKITDISKILDVTNGAGTPGSIYRFLADPEIVFYSLRMN
ncbi:MAG: metallophosphoesterase [Erysipelotrichaceae bacterium]|nr:metallophosphoesterase [Erysipelotrichaceae bacterium]